MVAGRIIAAVQIRTGWLILAILCSVLSATSLPAVLLWVGGPLQRKREAEEGLEKGGEKAAVAEA